MEVEVLQLRKWMTTHMPVGEMSVNRKRPCAQGSACTLSGDKPAQARDALTTTVPKARIIPNKVLVNTTGARYERWKQATSKELHAFLKTAWKGPTQELRSRYFAAKKKVVMQVLVFSLKPMTAEKRATGLH